MTREIHARFVLSRSKFDALRSDPRAVRVAASDAVTLTRFRFVRPAVSARELVRGVERGVAILAGWGEESAWAPGYACFTSADEVSEVYCGTGEERQVDTMAFGNFGGGGAVDGVLLERARDVGHGGGETRPASAVRPSQPRVSVVIPTKNEAENLPLVLPRIPAGVHEVIIVDAYSTDNTVDLAVALRPDIRIVMQEGRGKGAALRSGFAAASGDVVVMLDADGSTDPAEIPLFLGALLAGADFVKGSRFLLGGGTADMPLHRQLGNRFFVLLTRLLFGARYSDLCYGYNAFWADVIGALELSASGFEVETMMNIRAHQAGLRVAEVPSFEYCRKYGVGNLRTFADGWQVLKTIFAERRRRAKAHRDANGRVRSPHLPVVELTPELGYSTEAA